MSILKQTQGWTFKEWQNAYATSQIALDDLYTLISEYTLEDTAWIEIATEVQLKNQIEQLTTLTAQSADVLRDFPLYGLPFAVKDNIDVIEFTTTAACPDIGYIAEKDAFVVEKLKQAGAIVVGKANLDQFATGLVGTRSPYGAVTNSFNEEYVSGGSSSGSASVVARGLVAFSLGTDTAGSGRVPAGFNNIVGLKPTKGWFSTTGLIPACRTIDCISIFALTAKDANDVAQVMGGFDAQDGYSRQNPNSAPSRFKALKFAIPDKLEFCGDALGEKAFAESLEKLEEFGATIEKIDFSPFYQLAQQLYQGAWVAERTAAIGALLNDKPESIDPTVYKIAKSGEKFTAVDAYNAEYLRADLARKIQESLKDFDGLVVPTSPTIHTIAEMAEDPIGNNSHFGTYTNFTNFSDLSAIALPSTFRDDGLPFGITVLSLAWHDAALAYFGQSWQQFIDLPLGCTNNQIDPSDVMPECREDYVQLAVVGAHLTGMPLNFQLTTRDAVLLEKTTSADCYRLFALNNTVPPKPALKRDEKGQKIIVEVWEVPYARFGEIVAEVPTPLGIGNLELADGRWVKSFICEPYGLEDAKDISHFGGWRAYIQDLNKQK